MQRIVQSCIFVYSINVFLLIISLTFNVIIVTVRFKSIILLFICYLSQLFFVPFFLFFSIGLFLRLYIYLLCCHLSPVTLYLFKKCNSCCRVYIIHFYLISVYLQVVLHFYTYSIRTSQFHPGKSHEQRSLVSYSPWVCKGLDTTEQLHFHFFLSPFTTIFIDFIYIFHKPGNTLFFI